ncbi:MAG: hypothetical protein CVV27_03945 [Candidatus Melainabacteria bacterium HGW-Melainabacteria-1]|nr:MAG: hypothetical protein CVV27_03945 [Candidatus Melainabacteria bacterium HGW-Melainabacteria-1]
MRAWLIWPFILLGLSACPQPNPTELRSEPLTSAEASIQVLAGQNFTLVLPSLGANPNYKWVLQAGYDTALLRFDREREAASEFAGPAPRGYAPNRVFEFTALASGRSELLFVQEPVATGIAPTSSSRRYPVEIR